MKLPLCLLVLGVRVGTCARVSEKEAARIFESVGLFKQDAGASKKELVEEHFKEDAHEEEGEDEEQELGGKDPDDGSERHKSSSRRRKKSERRHKRSKRRRRVRERIRKNRRCAKMEVSVAGTLTDKVEESSGLACSRYLEGVCYTHNDSQDSARIFAISTDGKLLATIHLERARAKDWEDMSIAGHHIYIGDIGDNSARKDAKRIFRIREPDVSLADADDPKDITVEWEHFDFDMPEGQGRNSESMFVDSSGNNIYLITKKPDKGATEDVQGKKILKVAWGGEVAEDFGMLGGTIRGKTTGADMSPNDDLITLRTYSFVYIWKTNGKPPEEILQEKPCASLALKEKQGEAIGFSGDGKSMYTTSEGIGQPIHKISIL